MCSQVLHAWRGVDQSIDAIPLNATHGVACDLRIGRGYPSFPHRSPGRRPAPTTATSSPLAVQGVEAEPVEALAVRSPLRRRQLDQQPAAGSENVACLLGQPALEAQPVGTTSDIGLGRRVETALVGVWGDAGYVGGHD